MEHTNDQKAFFRGVGINFGKYSEIELRPSDSGISWVYNGRRLSSPHFKHFLNTTIAIFSDATVLYCVEHLMAAIALSGVTDVEICLSGFNELPLLDGSAKPFFVQLSHQRFSRKAQTVAPHIEIFDEHIIRGNDDVVDFILAPSKEWKATVFTSYPEPLGAGSVTNAGISLETLAAARTFIRDPVDKVPIELACRRLLGLESAIENDAIIIWNSETIVTPIRFASEWRYHKLLDLIGDIAMPLGKIRLEISAFSPGHQKNGRLRSFLHQRISQDEARSI